MALQKLKRQIASAIYKETKGIVQSGPFKGMKMLLEKSWNDDCLSSQLIGCYEAELHGPLELELNGKPKRVVNIGCAEGYYAVGLAMRLPESEIVAIDISDEAIGITGRAAAENGVKVRFPQSREEIHQYLNSADLIVCDCEGAEIEYLHPEKFPGLKNAAIIVELHDSPMVAATDTIAERFQGTHKMWVAVEDGRNPSRDPILRKFTDDQRWLAVSEGRPCLMHWFILKPAGWQSPATSGSGNETPT